MNTYSIADLEKAIKYAKAQNAVTMRIETQAGGFDRILLSVNESFKGSGAIITIYSAEAAKMPTITHSETLF